MDICKVMKRSAPAGAVLIMAVVVQFFTSCGSEYEKPLTTQTGSALISAATLSAWIDAGKVNSTGYDRVVILDVTDSVKYAAGHIPGALFLSSGDIAQDRDEGVGVSSYEVLEGLKMDELIRKYGIDGNTTVVFTSQTSLVHPARAYFTFRYWGFPRNRLKLLDGLNPAWNNAYGLTTDSPPVVARSGYSVRDNQALRDDLRASLAEMIDYAEGKDPDSVAIDVRGPTGSYAGTRGKTGGRYNPKSDYVVFEGRIKGAKALAGKTLYYPSNDPLMPNVFKPVDQLITAFTSTSIGLDSTKTAYVYCTKGAASSITFFILDGILGWPAAVYDGSWSQWGQLSDNAAMYGQLDAASPWRTDISIRSEQVAYNGPIISEVTWTATQNDLSTGGTFTGTSNSTFVVKIDGTGPDTFSWLISGTTTSAVNVPITAGIPQPLINGVTITFASDAGHALDDTWTFSATPGKAVEQLTADGNACSASYLPDGSITNSSDGTDDCSNLPDAWDTNANQIEEADKAYMQSGGSGGTTGGGGTSVPAGC